MKFNTTKGDCIFGIFVLGMSCALSIAVIVLDIVDESLVLPRSIVLIVGAVFFLIGVLFIMFNSMNVGELTGPETQASTLVTLLFLLCVFLMAAAGIIATL